MITKQKSNSITGAGREVIECRKEEDSEKAKAWPDTPAQAQPQLQVANATIDYYEKRELDYIKEARALKTHVQRLADALRWLKREPHSLEAIGHASWSLAQWEKEAK